MEGMKHCQYTIDALQCEYPFAHSGAHLVTVQDREVKWDYPDDLRDADLARGYPPCYRGYEHNNTLYVCTKPMGHEGMHESHDGLTFSEEDVERSLGPVAEDPPEANVLVTSQVVQEAVLSRATAQTSRIAVGGPGGQVDRHEVVGWQVQEGALYLHTPEQDIVYAAGQWAGLTAEPRS